MLRPWTIPLAVAVVLTGLSGCVPRPTISPLSEAERRAVSSGPVYVLDPPAGPASPYELAGAPLARPEPVMAFELPERRREPSRDFAGRVTIQNGALVSEGTRPRHFDFSGEDPQLGHHPHLDALGSVDWRASLAHDDIAYLWASYWTGDVVVALVHVTRNLRHSSSSDSDLLLLEIPIVDGKLARSPKIQWEAVAFGNVSLLATGELVLEANRAVGQLADGTQHELGPKGARLAFRYVPGRGLELAASSPMWMTRVDDHGYVWGITLGATPRLVGLRRSGEAFFAAPLRDLYGVPPMPTAAGPCVIVGTPKFRNDTSSSALRCFAHDGKVRWEKPLQSYHDVFVYPSGTVWLLQGRSVYQHAPNGELAWTFETPHDSDFIGPVFSAGERKCVATWPGDVGPQRIYCLGGAP